MDDKSTKRTHGTCAICKRLLTVDSSGRLAYHGFRRPGEGFQTASCFGAKLPCYEVSPAACEAYKVWLLRAIEDKKAYRARIESGEINTFTVGSHLRRRTVEPGSVEWTNARKNAIEDAARSIAGMERNVTAMEKRVQDWQPA